MAILVMWPRCSKQTFIPRTHWDFMWNLALIGPVVFEEMFETYMSLWKSNDPWGVTIFYPRAIR